MDDQPTNRDLLVAAEANAVLAVRYGILLAVFLSAYVYLGRVAPRMAATRQRELTQFSADLRCITPQYEQLSGIYRALAHINDSHDARFYVGRVRNLYIPEIERGIGLGSPRAAATCLDALKEALGGIVELLDLHQQSRCSMCAEPPDGTVVGKPNRIRRAEPDATTDLRNLALLSECIGGLKEFSESPYNLDWVSMVNQGLQPQTINGNAGGYGYAAPALGTTILDGFPPYNRTLGTFTTRPGSDMLSWKRIVQAVTPPFPVVSIDDLDQLAAHLQQVQADTGRDLVPDTLVVPVAELAISRTTVLAVLPVILALVLGLVNSHARDAARLMPMDPGSQTLSRWQDLMPSHLAAVTRLRLAFWVTVTSSIVCLYILCDQHNLGVAKTPGIAAIVAMVAMLLAPTRVPGRVCDALRRALRTGRNLSGVLLSMIRRTRDALRRALGTMRGQAPGAAGKQPTEEDQT